MSVRLSIEVTGVCNASCAFCPFPTAENVIPKIPMTPDLYLKIITEAAQSPNITEIGFANLCEPMLDRHIVERVRIARNARPDWRIEIYTNGVYCTPDKFDQLKAAGLNGLVFSVNAVIPEQHEKIMGLKGKFDIVCANADYAIAHGDSMYIETHAVLDGVNFEQASAWVFQKRWGKFGKVITQGSWADDPLPGVTVLDTSKACERALGQVCILRNGVVGMCCVDPLAKYPWGDVSKQTLQEVYSSPAYVQFREDHFNNQADKNPVCKTCTRR